MIWSVYASVVGKIEGKSLKLLQINQNYEKKFMIKLVNWTGFLYTYFFL